MSLYKNSIDAIRENLNRKFPNVSANEGTGEMSGENLVSNVLWMAQQIEKMDSDNREACLKASRWIGWMMRVMEELGFWNNAKTRELIRLDRF